MGVPMMKNKCTVSICNVFAINFWKATQPKKFTFFPAHTLLGHKSNACLFQENKNVKVL